MSVRGLVLVAVAVAVGAVLLPSATAKTPAGSSQPVAAVAGRGTGQIHVRATEHRASSASAAHGSHGASSSSTVPGSTAPSTSSPASASTGPTAGSVQILVANGTNMNGVAAVLSTQLHAKGYGTLAAVTALTTVPSTLVYPLDTAGSDALSQLLGVLGLTSSAVRTAVDGPPPVSSATGADVVVVIGPGLASRLGSGASATGG